MNLLKDSSIFLMNVLYDSVKRKLILVTPGTQRVNGIVHLSKFSFNRLNFTENATLNAEN